MSQGAAELRRLARAELARVGEIDRTERIDALYIQRGSVLERHEGDFSAGAWRRDVDGEYSVAAQRAALERYVDGGAVALGAFAGERLVGIGVVVLHLRRGVSQLAYLYVTSDCRGMGIGRLLSDELERIARDAQDSQIVVSATPSENTVRFYRRRGFEPMDEPYPELFELEPDDVHMLKAL